MKTLIIALLCLSLTVHGGASNTASTAIDLALPTTGAHVVDKPTSLSESVQSLGLSRSLSATREIFLEYIPPPQDDDWSCGISALSRITQSLGYDVPYPELKRHIDFYDIPISINVCDILSLGQLPITFGNNDFCAVKFSIKHNRIKIGNPPPEFVRKINNWAGSGTANYEFASSPHAGLDRVKQLIQQNRPVIVNLMVGNLGWESRQLNLGPFGTYTFSFLIPELHYVVVYGYDSNSVYYHNSDGESYRYSNSEFLRNWGWDRNYYSRDANFVTRQMWELGARPLGLVYLNRPIPLQDPGCGCECCCPNETCFCLVPCGCACKVPASHFNRVRVRNGCGKSIRFALMYRELSPNYYRSFYQDVEYEGKWRTRYWWDIPAQSSSLLSAKTQSRYIYYFAEVPTTGQTWSGDATYGYVDGKRVGMYRHDAGDRLGVTSEISLVCSNKVERHRVYVSNGCEYANSMKVLVRYRNLDGLWKFRKRVVSFRSESYFGDTALDYFYYHASAANDFVWVGSSSYSYEGVSYRMRHKTIQQPFRKYTLTLTCSCEPRNCQLGSWSSWGTCKYESSFATSTSNGHVQKRTRSVVTQRNMCGTGCVGSLVDFKSCTPQTVEPTDDPYSTDDERLRLVFQGSYWKSNYNDLHDSPDFKNYMRFKIASVLEIDSEQVKVVSITKGEPMTVFYIVEQSAGVIDQEMVQTAVEREVEGDCHYMCRKTNTVGGAGIGIGGIVGMASAALFLVGMGVYALKSYALKSNNAKTTKPQHKPVSKPRSSPEDGELTKT